MGWLRVKVRQNVRHVDHAPASTLSMHGLVCGEEVARLGGGKIRPLLARDLQADAWI